MPPGRLPLRFSRRVLLGGGPGADPGLTGGIISLLAWENLGISQEELESVAGERVVWVSLLDLLPP